MTPVLLYPVVLASMARSNIPAVSVVWELSLPGASGDILLPTGRVNIGAVLCRTQGQI